MRRALWAVSLAAGFPFWAAPCIAQPAHAPMPAGSRAAAEGTPAVDHHMHIVSPAAAQLMAPPQLSPIALPADLQALLNQRGAAPSADLFLADAHMLDIRGPMWVRGRGAISAFLAGAQPGARFVATGYSGNANAAAVTGVVERGEREAARPVRNFHMSLVKAAEGWRIAAESWSERAPPVAQPTSAASLVRELDEAGIGLGIVHALGYFQASPMLPRPLPDEALRVSAENDWVVAQISSYRGRLLAFCGVNPLREHAIAELRRCRTLPGVAGVKLHLANSGVDLAISDHVQRLRAFFRAADDARMPIAVHLWSGPAYGAEHVRVFLQEIMPVALNIPVQVMHLSGGGGAYGPDEAIAEFVASVERRDPAARNLYFDVAAVVMGNEPPAVLALIASRIRALGVERVLFGTDRDGAQALPPGPAWAAFNRLPLRAEEFRAIARNVAPYAKGR